MLWGMAVAEETRRLSQGGIVMARAGFVRRRRRGARLHEAEERARVEVDPRPSPVVVEYVACDEGRRWRDVSDGEEAQP